MSTSSILECACKDTGKQMKDGNTANILAESYLWHFQRTCTPYPMQISAVQ